MPTDRDRHSKDGLSTRGSRSGEATPQQLGLKAFRNAGVRSRSLWQWRKTLRQVPSGDGQETRICLLKGGSNMKRMGAEARNARRALWFWLFLGAMALALGGCMMQKGGENLLGTGILSESELATASQGTMGFRVTDTAGTPLAGIVVAVVTGSRTSVTGTTGADGRVQVNGSCSSAWIMDPRKEYATFLFSESSCRIGNYEYPITLKKVSQLVIGQQVYATTLTPADAIAFGYTFLARFTGDELLRGVKSGASWAMRIVSAIISAGTTVSCIGGTAGWGSVVCVAAGVKVFAVAEAKSTAAIVVADQVVRAIIGGLGGDLHTPVEIYVKSGSVAVPIMVRGSELRVTSPNGGEPWREGSTQTIRWTSVGVAGSVRIDLSRDGGSTWTTIISSTPNDGSEPWRVTGPGTTRARIRVVSLSNPSTSGISSGNFTIDNAIGISVIAPNGGETWEVGSTQTIRWASTGGITGFNVRVDLSRDGGSTWTTIISSTPNDGSEPWRVTGPATTRARIRVVATINTTPISGTSAGNFTIRSQVGSVRVTIEPASARSAGARWRLTSGPDTNWKDSGATVSNLPVGTYTVTFRAITGWVAPGNASVTINANQTVTLSRTYSQPFDFSLSANPSTLTVTRPRSGTVQVSTLIQARRTAGPDTTVDFTTNRCVGIPGIALATPCTWRQIVGNVSVALRLSISSTTPLGTHTITITGQGAGRTRSVTLRLIVR